MSDERKYTAYDHGIDLAIEVAEALTRNLIRARKEREDILATPRPDGSRNTSAGFFRQDDKDWIISRLDLIKAIIASYGP